MSDNTAIVLLGLIGAVFWLLFELIDRIKRDKFDD